MRRNFGKDLLRLTACTMTMALLFGCGKQSDSQETEIAVTETVEESTTECTSEEETTTEVETLEAETTEEETEDEFAGISVIDAKETTASSKKETKDSSESKLDGQAKETTAVQTTAGSASSDTSGKTQAATPVSISAAVSGTHYIGDTLSASDFTVCVNMSDGTALTNPGGWGASPLTLSSATNTVTVTYGSVSTQISVAASQRPSSGSSQSTQSTTASSQTSDTNWTCGVNGEACVYHYDGMNIDVTASKHCFEIQNQIRAQAGLSAIQWDDNCFALACLRVMQVTRTGSAHTDYLGTENTAFAFQASCSEIMSLFTSSSGHYAAMTIPSIKKGAIAVYNNGGTVNVVSIIGGGASVYATYDEAIASGATMNSTASNPLTDAAVASGLITKNANGKVYQADVVVQVYEPMTLPYADGYFNGVGNQPITYGAYRQKLGYSW